MQLNYFPITIEFDRYQIFTEPYSVEKLTELRSEYNSTHSFFRNGDFIYISNKDGKGNDSIGSLTQRNVYDDKEITASLIKHVFFRTFKDRFPDLTPVDFYPFRFFSRNEKDDIIVDLLPDNLKNTIAYKKLIEVQLKFTEIKGKKQFSFIISIKRNWVFNKTCQDLHAEGYDLIGLDVLHSEILPGLTDILAPNEDFIGVIKEIIENNAKIETNDGIKEFALNELFIKKTKYNIGRYLAFATSEQKSSQILQRIESKRSEIYNPKKLYAEISKIAKLLFTEKKQSVLFLNKDGFCFEVSQSPLVVYNEMELKKPTFIFDPAVTKTNLYPDIGLSNYGPYDSINFDTKKPLVLSICSRENRGEFAKFLYNLKDGLPQSKYFQKGLVKKYDLQDLTFDIREIITYDVKEYLNIIKNNSENKPHIAIIEIPTNFREYEDRLNPYYIIKAKLLSLEIPVQFITTEKIKICDEYILNAISLQIYSKLGGIPWVLPSRLSVDREIIIGIGHSWVRKNQYKGSEQNRVVGITTFLSSDGQYLLGDKVKDVSFEDYFSELLHSLESSIDRLSNEQGWSQGDTIRLIFHIFKPIKNTEFDVIRQLINKYPQFKINFAFVTISKSHPNMLFDINQAGIKKYGSSELKGEYIPVRGTNVFLDNQTSIVQMLGASELKTARHAMSNPIQIRIRVPQGNYDDAELNDLLFYDLGYITQQVFSFTYLSWRSFLPGEQPATMLYSNLISKLLSKMRKVPGWDVDKLNYGLKRKKWFL